MIMITNFNSFAVPIKHNHMYFTNQNHGVNKASTPIKHNGLYKGGRLSLAGRLVGIIIMTLIVDLFRVWDSATEPNIKPKAVVLIKHYWPLHDLFCYLSLPTRNYVLKNKYCQNVFINIISESQSLKDNWNMH